MADPLPQWIRRMQSADFYPHPVESLTLRETHISWVFLTGSFVYKVKKAVDLGFLDFTTLDKRERYCRREVALNRRHSRDVYLGVLPITAQSDGYRLDGAGETVEVAVKMRQLPARDTLKQRLRAGAVERSAIDRLAVRLARFHAAAPGGPAVARFGAPEVIRKNCAENFDSIARCSDGAIDPRRRDVIAAATRDFIDSHDRLLVDRQRQGRIRDGHGDLRTDHVYLTDGEVQILDCIEFSDRLRCGDAVSDLAFLAMGIDRLNAPRVGARLAAAYARHADDFRLFALLDFYKCYRAMVRVKVDCMRLNQPDIAPRQREVLRERIDGHLHLAYRYAVRFSRSTLWIVCGPVAAGKSTLARALGDALDIRIVRSDRVRKRLLAGPDAADTQAPYGRGIYSRQASALTYARLLLEAQAEMAGGRSVILDATFSRADRRRDARRLAQDMHAEVLFVECLCREAAIRRRLRQRTAQESLSDARIEHFDRLQAAFEPLTELAPDHHVRVDGETCVADNLQAIFSHQAAAGGD